MKNRLNSAAGAGDNVRKPDEASGTSGKANENIPSVAKDPDEHYELTYRSRDEFGEWLRRHSDLRKPRPLAGRLGM